MPTPFAVGLRLAVSVPMAVLASASGAICFRGYPLPKSIAELLTSDFSVVWIWLLFVGSMLLVVGPWLAFSSFSKHADLSVGLVCAGSFFAGGMPIVYAAAMWMRLGLPSQSFLGIMFMLCLGLLIISIAAVTLLLNLKDRERFLAHLTGQAGSHV